MPSETSPGAASIPADMLSLIPQTPWYKQPHLLRLNLAILSLILFSSTNGYDGSLMNGILALPLWNTFMAHPKGSYLGFISAIYSLGCTIGYPTAAWAANRFGRRPTLYAGYFFMVMGTALQTGAPNAAAFILARLFLGFAGGAFLPAPLLIAENAYPTQRAILSSIYNCGWYAGAVVAAWVVFAAREVASDWCWRIPSLLQIALPILTIPGFLMIDESPRWLVSRGRIAEARAILVKNHAGGDEDSALVNFEMNEIESAIVFEKANGTTNWSDLWATKGNRHRLWITLTLGVFTQWVGNGVVSYYLSLILESVGITSVTHQTLISACLQIWNLFWASFAAFNTDKIGRRPLLLASAIIMLVSYIIITGLSGSFASTGNRSVGLAVIPFLFVYFFGYDVSLTPMLIAYPVEIWPYSHRATGLSLALLTSLGCNFFNIFVNSIALDAIGWKYYFVFVSCLIAFLAIAYFTYPETRGRTLEQVALLFDGDEAEEEGIITVDDILQRVRSGVGVGAEGKDVARVEAGSVVSAGPSRAATDETE